MFPIAYSDQYIYQLPEGHKFPIEKYGLIREQLILEGTCTQEQFFDAGLLEDAVIHQTHCPRYWEKVTQGKLTDREQRRIGIPIYEQSLLRVRNSAAGTVRTLENALVHGVAFNLAGGTHHAFYDRGEAFSVLNDIALGIDQALSRGTIKKALVADLDVHQGNGTATLFANREEVFTFSMHGRSNYPLQKECSDRDVELEPGTGDREYLALLEENLSTTVEQHCPNLLVYQAGVDVLASDKLGSLTLSQEGCRQRDRLVFEFCRTKGLPVAVTMGGGYSPRVADVVNAHVNTFRMARTVMP